MVLPIVTTSVKRVFLPMNVVKIDLHKKIRNEWMNDSLIVYIKRKVFASIDNATIG